jgi:hypothetical protein
MLTIFSIPKAFRGHAGIIQRNALQSWIRLRPQVEVILLGNDEGTAEAAREAGVRHIPDVATNEHGTPLLNDIFRQAEMAAAFPWMCYVNADIIVLDDFVETLQHAQKQLAKFLYVAKRVNIDISEPLAFAEGWQNSLKNQARSAGSNGPHTAIDVFAFPKGTYAQMPDFFIGRLWFDQWLIKAAIENHLPVVDASRVAAVLHQNHDYGHVPGGYDQVWRGKEAEHNFRLYGGVQHAYTLLDVTHELTPEGRLRETHFRKPLIKTRQLAWDLLVRRTAGARHALGLHRHRPGD